MPEFDYTYPATPGPSRPWPTVADPPRPWTVNNVWPSSPLGTLPQAQPCAHEFHELTQPVDYTDAAGYPRTGPAIYCRRCGVVHAVRDCLEAKP